MTDTEWTREALGDMALSSLEVMCRLGIGTVYLRICPDCNHPSAHQSKDTEQYCPYCGDVVTMGRPAFSGATGPLAVK